MNASLNSSVSLGAAWDSPYSPVVQVIIWVIASLLSLETIVGNAMVIVAYKLQRSISKQVSNRYIVSLAISDLIIGIEGIPLFTVYVVNGDRWPLGVIACETWLFLDYTLCLVSILTVLLITADRYLSVCHTAKYLKWQSPTKTQVLIVLSWVFPAIMFGFMIYGWSLLGGDGSGNASYEEGECFAPFLSNPYVNMGMYVAYYWTTLVAMLILYKGIHQAAKNLEKKAKAKEHRHIALLLTQRLGTQVGVSLMLQSRRHESLPSIDDDSKRNSVVQTNIPTTAGENQSDALEGAALNSIKELPPGENVHVIRRHRLTDHRSSSKSKHAILRNVKSANMTTNYKANEPDRMALDEKQFQDSNFCNVSDSISTRFDDDSFSSILQFKISDTPLEVAVSDTTSPICSEQSTKTRTHSSKWSKLNENFNNEYNQINVTDENGQITTTVECLANSRQPQRSGLFSLFRRGFQLFYKPRLQNVPAVRSIPPHATNMSRSSSASSSCSSSSEMHDRPPSTRRHMMAPTVTVTRENNRTKSSIESLNGDDDVKTADPFLSTLGTHRKVSTFSQFTKDTRNRVLQSIFSPIIALNRGRKQTKAEKRAHKAFRTITFIVGLFAILWSPYYVVATIYGFCKGECIPPLLYNLSYYMCYLNSSGNPFAYALANRQFRTAFIRMFHEPADAVTQVFTSILNLFMVIFHAIRKALGFRIAQDDVDDFYNKPSPNFISAAPRDPNYQTLASLDNAIFNEKPKQPPTVVRRK